MWFEYDQNNSGGSFDIDREKGIGPRVWIEAPTLNVANARAEDIGIYFDGVADGIDCPCCGSRWSEPWQEGVEVPNINPKYDFSWHDAVYFHKLDGTLVTVKKDGTVTGDKQLQITKVGE